MARKSILATLVGIAALAVPSAFADKGGIPHAGSNGKGSAAGQAQSHSQSQSQSQGQAKANGHAKTHVKTQVKVQAKGHAYAKGQTKSHANANGQTQGHAYAKGQTKVHGNGQTKVKTHGRPATGTTGTPTTNIHAKAGKTTICHATGSATNPYVTITISNNALPAHRRHQDGRDIIPAPEGGCPTTSSQTEQPPTGSQEQGGEQNNTPTPTETQSTTGTTGTTGATGQVMGQTVSGTSTPTASTGSGTTSPSGEVLGTSTSGSTATPSASNNAAATATRASSSSKLPFTGTDAIIVAILGLAALLVGVSVRRAATHRAKA